MTGTIAQNIVPMRYDRTQQATSSRALAVEAAIAFEYNGIAYAVMMATPTDLEDFATGFTLSERLIDHADEIMSLTIAPLPQGWVIRIELPKHRAQPLLERARLRLIEGSCGLCGVETIAQIMQPLPKVETSLRVQREAIGRALGDLEKHQPLGRQTGAMHAAAFCAPDGAIILVREDIGRHNAVDKLWGAMALKSLDAARGFMLLTARCSYELVQKAALAKCPILVTLSAPTSLAVARAQEAGMTLISLARKDGALILTDIAGRII